MGIYRKKPLEVEAVEWTGENLEEVRAFAGIMSNMDGDVSICRFLHVDARDNDGELIWSDHQAHLWVEANHAWIPVPVGQWVLRDRAGLYPCKPDIFEQTYEAI